MTPEPKLPLKRTRYDYNVKTIARPNQVIAYAFMRVRHAARANQTQYTHNHKILTRNTND